MGKKQFSAILGMIYEVVQNIFSCIIMRAAAVAQFTLVNLIKCTTYKYITDNFEIFHKGILQWPPRNASQLDVKDIIFSSYVFITVVLFIMCVLN